METKTLQNNSPPGYFDLSQYQNEGTQKIFAWFNNFKNSLQSEANNFDYFYRLFLSVNYTEDISTDFLLYIASQYGLKNISLPANSMRDLLIYASTPKRKKLSDNIQAFIDFLFSQGWISDFGDVFVGYNSRSRYAETFIIYSDSVTLPVTPLNTEYIPLKWDVPDDWTKIPSSSTYYCRGFLYEGEVIWCDPLPTDTIVLYDIVSTLVDLPPSPTEGDICLVANDGTEDFQAVYYYDGNEWQKNSSPNENQKNANETNALQGSEVFAPDDFMISSSTIPPVDGHSKGWGFYGVWGIGSLVNRISFNITLTDIGFPNLGLIVQLIKKIKPLGNLLIVYATYLGETQLLEINDLNAL